jgi:hypothetical protein
MLSEKLFINFFKKVEQQLQKRNFSFLMHAGNFSRICNELNCSEVSLSDVRRHIFAHTS